MLKIFIETRIFKDLKLSTTVHLKGLQYFVEYFTVFQQAFSAS